MAVMRFLPNPYRPPPTAEDPRRLEMDRVVVVQMICLFHLFAALFSAGYLLMQGQGAGNNVGNAVLDSAHFLNTLMICLSLVGFALVVMISITIPKWPRRFRVYLPSIDFVLFLLHFGVAMQIRIS